MLPHCLEDFGLKQVRWHVWDVMSAGRSLLVTELMTFSSAWNMLLKWVRKRRVVKGRYVQCTYLTGLNLHRKDQWKKIILAFMVLEAIFFFSHKVDKTSYEMLTKHHSLDRFMSVKCMVSAAIICKCTCTNCFSSWLLKEQSSQRDLLKVDRKYQV